MSLFNFGKKKKFEKLKKCLEEENYEAAVLIADQIPVHKVKKNFELNMLGKAYKKHEDFFVAKDFFERSYKQRVSRTVLMDLMDCCLEIKDLEHTEKYFNEYQKLAPDDKVTQYKYRYEIEKRKGRERKLLIMILEELKVLEYVEEYAYELALQYHKAGRKQECINECNDIILWFGVGESVERARILLAYYKGEISLEEIESGGISYPKKPTIQEKLKDDVEEDKWISQKAEKLRKEVKKMEETMNFREQVKKAEESARLRKEARYAEEVKKMQEQMKKTAEELKQVEVTVETIKEEEMKKQEEKIDSLEEAVNEVAVTKDENEAIVSENKNNFIEKSFAFEETKENPFFVLEPETIEVSKETYRELADLLESKGISLSKILKSFGRVEHIKQQVLRSMDIVLKTKECSFFAVTGEEQSGKTTLEKTMIKLLFELGLIQYDRTAIVDATQLNQISIKEYKSQLKNCNMIIEHAGSMTEKTIEGLVDFFRENKKETCLFLEDSNANIAQLLSSKQPWAVLFYNQILLQPYTTKELMGFAYDCITKEDYSIDNMAAKVLYERIDEIVKFHGKESSLSYVVQLIKATLRHAEQRVNNILLEMVSQGKIQEGNHLIILPEDISNNVIL